MKKQPKLNHCTKCKAHFSMEPGKHVCPPWMILKKTDKPPSVPVEFCPECMSLKRKPNKDCKSHDSYWVDIEVTKLYRDIKNSGLKNATDTLAEQMVKQIANKHIKVQDTHEGKSHQRHWYLVAQKMLKKLMKEYEKLCKTSYD